MSPFRRTTGLGQSWPFERMPDLVILPVDDLTAGQRPAKSRYWMDHGNLPEHGDDPESNRGRVRVPRRLRERPDLELRNCRDEEDFSGTGGCGNHLPTDPFHSRQERGRL